MSTFRNPVGPQPSKVYWRRRLVLALGLLAVIVVIVLIVARPGASQPQPVGTASPSPVSTGAATVEVACDPAKITLEAVTDASSYEAGVNPMMSLVVKSTATEPCTINAGSDVQEFRITSGDELIWSSKDCQSAPEPRVQVLKPGVPVSTAPIPWDRTRSAADTCDTQREQVIAGGASYHLEVVLGDLTSAETRQFLIF